MPPKRKRFISPSPVPAKRARKEGVAPAASTKKGKGNKKEVPIKSTKTTKKNVKRNVTAPKVKVTKKTEKGKKTGDTANKAGGKKGKKSEVIKAKQKMEKKASQAEVQKSSVSTAGVDGTFSLQNLLKNERWKQVLAEEFKKLYFTNLEDFLRNDYREGKEIFPPKELIFNALHLTPLEKVTVVILGQDPYHDDGQAMGMSFSVPKGIAIPPSLRNIYTELERDPKIKGFTKPDHGCLEKWAKEGILMINATLTVEAHKPNSHVKYGWQFFTDSIIKAVSDNCDHVVFILWGGFAHKKEPLIDLTKHVTIKTAHPSPLSLNKFKNCNCFSDCDAALVKFGLKPIDWSLD